LGKQFLGVFVSLLSLSLTCGFELFILIPRLDLGVVIIVVACVYFDIGCYFPCSTHHSFIGVSFESKFTTIGAHCGA